MFGSGHFFNGPLHGPTGSTNNKASQGSGFSAMEQRMQQLQTMIQRLEKTRQAPPLPTMPNDVAQGVEEVPPFRSFLMGAEPPPKAEPLNDKTRHRKASIQPIVQKYAQAFGIDPKLINAVIHQESAFNPNAVSRVGARGLMQLMPSTAKWLGVNNAFDPEQNVAAGTRYLAGLMKKYRGNIPLALAAYNAGSGAVDKHNGIPPYKETQQYVQRILASYLKQRNSTVS